MLFYRHTIRNLFFVCCLLSIGCQQQHTSTNTLEQEVIGAIFWEVNAHLKTTPLFPPGTDKKDIPPTDDTTAFLIYVMDSLQLLRHFPIQADELNQFQDLPEWTPLLTKLASISTQIHLNLKKIPTKTQFKIVSPATHQSGNVFYKTNPLSFSRVVFNNKLTKACCIVNANGGSLLFIELQDGRWQIQHESILWLE